MLSLRPRVHETSGSTTITAGGRLGALISPMTASSSCHQAIPGVVDNQPPGGNTALDGRAAIYLRLEGCEVTATEFDLFDIMRTTRSMRRLKPDPVPDALLSKILESGTFAASGGNMLSWRFLVIRDRAIKESAGAFYRKACH